MQYGRFGQSHALEELLHRRDSFGRRPEHGIGPAVDGKPAGDVAVLQERHRGLGLRAHALRHIPRAADALKRRLGKGIDRQVKPHRHLNDAAVGDDSELGRVLVRGDQAARIDAQGDDLFAGSLDLAFAVAFAVAAQPQPVIALGDRERAVQHPPALIRDGESKLA